MKSKRQSMFEVYPHEYDLLTNAATREKSHALEVAAMIKRFSPATVLDAGCATGLTTLLFARQGVEAVGLDRSKPMLAIAQAERRPEGLPIVYRYGAFENLPKRMYGKFDLVACLANAIVGVETVAGLQRAIRNFFAVMRPGGSLVLQMLNYRAIRENELMPIKATQNGSIVYERFSKRYGSRMAMFVTRADFGTTPPVLEVFDHEFDNFSPEQVTKAAERAGFREIRQYADLYFKKRFGARARDLVLTARRPQPK